MTIAGECIVRQGSAFVIFLIILLISPWVSTNSVGASLKNAENHGLLEQRTEGDQTASEASKSQIQRLLERIEELTGIKSVGTLVILVTILFYLTLLIFLILWMIEKTVKSGRKIIGRPHKEYKSKKIFRVAFTASLVGKTAVFCLAVAGIFIEALATSQVFERYIQQPKDLWELVRDNRAFLVIFGLIVIAEIYRFRRRRKKKEISAFQDVSP